LVQGLGGIPDVSWSEVPQSASGVCGDLATNLVQGLGGIPNVSWSQVPQSAGGVCGDLETVASLQGILNIYDGSKQPYTTAGGGNSGMASRSSDS
jgi:hypothetical protein